MGLYLRRDLSREGESATPTPWRRTFEISAAVDPGAHAVLIVDQAGWHLTPKLAIPDNITVLALPPRSPELNPVENVWQFMRDNWLSNRIFKSYEDIVALCCQAWNNLIDQPWKIMSLGMRKWAMGSDQCVGISRSLQDLLTIVEVIREKGAGFRSLAEDIDTTTPAGRLVFHVFASIAQFERERISERTKEGLSAARKRGRIGGRPPALSPERRAEVRQMRDQDGRGIAELARLFKVSPNTIRRV